MKRAALRTRLAVRSSHYTTYIDLAWRSGQVVRALPRSKMAPILKEPRSALRKAMARRAKNSHLGAFQTLPEHVLLSCLARLPREDHDAVADASVGFRAIMRSERFLKARRAEEITEEALVVVGDCFMALVSGRVWRRLVPMSAEMRILGGVAFGGVARAGIAVIGSELFLAGGMKQNSTYAGVSVYDAVDDEWFTIPLSSSAYSGGTQCELFAVACAGRLYVGSLSRYDPHRGRVFFQSFDPDAQRWVDMPPMPPPLPVVEGGFTHQLVAVAVGSEIYILDRMEPEFFRVFDAATQSWGIVDIPEEVEIVDLSDWNGPYNYKVPWPGICVDRTLIHLSDYRRDGEPSNVREHYAYDTVNDQWISFDGGMPRHTAYGESYRILSVVNYNGPNDYVVDSPRYSPGGVWGFQRRGEHGCIVNETMDLPVRYDTVERVFYIDMP